MKNLFGDPIRDLLYSKEVNFGGGSGKSRSICQRLCYLFLNQDDIIIAVVRASMPILKKSVYLGDPSIVRTLRDWNVPVDDWMNKSEATIVNPINKSEIRFIGLDSAEKIKSQNWNYCWIEEATELTMEKWSQCNTRMRRPNKHGPDQMFISYNPINVFNWVIQLFVVAPSKYISENSLVHFSNFMDNPFLPKDAIISMFDTAEKDENYYWTYVVGKPGVPIGQIYPSFKLTYKDGIYDEDEDGNLVCIQEPWPEGVWDVEPYYGIDFGYVDEMAVTEIREYNDAIYARLIFYDSQKTMKQLYQALRDNGVTSSTMLYCDSAEKDRIVDLSLNGFCPNPAAKSIHAGIMYLKSREVYIDISGRYGECFKEEVQGYMWDKDKDDPRILLDEPADGQKDHAVDSFRYGAYTKHLRDTKFSVDNLDMGDISKNPSGKSSKEILAEMQKSILKS